MLVEKLAAESGMVLLALTPSAVLSKWSGESEKMIRSVFATANTMQPAIVFIVRLREWEERGQGRAANDNPRRSPFW